MALSICFGCLVRSGLCRAPGKRCVPLRPAFSPSASRVAWGLLCYLVSLPCVHAAVKLPHLLAMTSFEHTDFQKLQPRLGEFLKFLQKNQARLFENSYSAASEAYVRKAEASGALAGTTKGTKTPPLDAAAGPSDPTA